MLLSLIAIVLISTTSVDATKAGTPAKYYDAPSPIVFLPSLGASGLELRVTNHHARHWRHWYCVRNSGHWFTGWLSLRQLTLTPDCWVDNVRMRWNMSQKEATNQYGVESRVPHWDDIGRLEFIHDGLLPSWVPLKGIPFILPYDYIHAFVTSAVTRGYVRNVTVRAAPYDWRASPNMLDGYYEKLTKLIEDTYEVNKGRKVTLIGHSYGANVGHAFLVNKSQEWKDKYVKLFVTAGGALGGLDRAIDVYASHEHGGLKDKMIVSKLFEAFASFPSVAYLLPPENPKGHEDHLEDHVLVETPSANYTTRDTDLLLGVLGHPDTRSLRRWTRDNSPSIETPPGVPVVCLYGTGRDTFTRLRYRRDSDMSCGRSGEAVMTRKGDDTVTERSMSLCRQWLQDEDRDLKIFEGIHHMSMFNDVDVMNYVLNKINE